MEQLLELLKQQPKEIIQWLILELMRDNKLSFTDIAEMHIKYLEMLRKGESEKLVLLRSKIIALWCGTKKDLPKSLTALITEGMNDGWVNITQEQIDKSKWNK
jgi:hypothetical protein